MQALDETDSGKPTRVGVFGLQVKVEGNDRGDKAMDDDQRYWMRLMFVMEGCLTSDLGEVQGLYD